MFKLIGFILGWLFFGFWGALLGLFAGSFADRVRVYGAGAVNPLQNSMRQAVFLETVFVLMGRLAKADGQVSQHEIDHAEAFMQRLGMTSEHRQQAIAYFRQGVDPATDLDKTCARFMSVCGHTRDLPQMLLVSLVVMALADGHFHPAEEALLSGIAERLGYDQAAFRQLLEMVLNQTHFGADKATSAAALDDAYKALGVSRENTDAEVKRAYRKLISQYHPDKLIGQGMPEDMVKVATEQAKEIQLAYDLIKQSRNL